MPSRTSSGRGTVSSWMSRSVSKGRKLLFGGLRRGDPHLDAWTVALDRERYGLAVHPRGDTHEYAHIVLLLSKTSYTHCTSPVPRQTHANFLELRAYEVRRISLPRTPVNRASSAPCTVFLRGKEVREPLDAGTQGTSASYTFGKEIA